MSDDPTDPIEGQPLQIVRGMTHSTYFALSNPRWKTEFNYYPLMIVPSITSRPIDTERVIYIKYARGILYVSAAPSYVLSKIHFSTGTEFL